MNAIYRLIFVLKSRHLRSGIEYRIKAVYEAETTMGGAGIVGYGDGCV